jgi:Protein of unknown function (DUF1592)/Protein of unknown function (DUF1588)/Protein of unknown function (DUF1587)/Protein of unknown function (DUF1585)/Protein of unknown function (DUF1595)/Ca-dependent carbohydrate-binding module xylan-binding/Planctomycete cytochrome C
MLRGRPLFKVLIATIGGWIAASAGGFAATQPELESAYHQEILPIFEKLCYDCHGDGRKKSGLALDDFGDIPSMIANREVWKNIRAHIDFRLMPPPDKISPSDAEREKLLTWIDDAVFAVDPSHPDPGHVMLKRLNRVEYENTIRDLLGVEIDAGEILPPDDTGYGFDNIGDVLTLSPVHLERYLAAARMALDLAVHPDPMTVQRTEISGKKIQGDGIVVDGHLLFTNGQAFSKITFPGPGRYQIRVTASSDWGGSELSKCDIVLDGNILTTWEVPNAGKHTKTVTYEVSSDQEVTLRVAAFFTNDRWEPENPDPKQRDRNLTIHQIAVDGPLDGPPPPKPKTHQLIYGEQRSGQSSADYMKVVLKRFARRAFRRAVKDEEIERYFVFLSRSKKHGGDVQHAIRDALEAMLVSPAFLFREEPTELEGGRKLISEYALASRLSYFLWSSMPDETLLALADAGKLRENLTREVQRMIASSQSSAFVVNFTGQWLQLRDMPGVSPSEEVFPNFDRLLVLDMRKETEMLVAEVMQHNLPVMTLLNADYTFLNQRLAEHYGMTNVQGDRFRKVSLVDTPRRGILNHGSFLTLTAYPDRTSPVRRGKYVLENILDTPPPPPPPNIPQLTGVNGHGEGEGLRQQMEKHRDDPKCSSCHALMDPIGFGLENFNALGTWRNQENGQLIDASGKLVTGQAFANMEQLRDIITRDHRKEFHRALASKMLTYSLGRGLDWYDRPTVDHIVMKAGGDDLRMISLIQAIVDSVPFQYRR